MWNCLTSFLIIVVSIKRCNPLNCTENGPNRCFYSQPTNNELQTRQIVPQPELVFATSNTLSPPAINPQPSDTISLSNEFSSSSSRRSRSHSLHKEVMKRETLQQQGNRNSTRTNTEQLDETVTRATHVIIKSTLTNDSIAEMDDALDGNNTTNGTLFEVPCDEHQDQNCIIDHTQICVGDPRYCNLTYDEYIELLYEYIAPTTSEWILIVSHSVVFTVGLVRTIFLIIFS